MDKRHDITSYQLASFCLTAQVGLGILTLPSILAKEVGHNAWIPTLLAGVGILFLIIIIMKLLKRYSSKTIFEINRLLYGKYLGVLFNVLIIGWLCFSAGINLRMFTELVSILTLNETPPLVVTLLLISPSLYLSAKGLKIISRFSFYMYIPYFLMVFSFIFLFRHMRITYLLPVGDVELKKIIKGLWLTSFPYIGFELVAFIYPNITDKENSMKAMLGTIILSTIYYVIVIITATALFGEVMLAHIEFPLFTMQQSIRVPIIERIDIFFLTIWFPTMASSMRAYFFTSYYSIKKLLNFKDRGIFFLIAFAIVEIMISRIPSDYEASSYYINLSGVITFVFVFFLVISYLLSFINRRGVTVK